MVCGSGSKRAKINHNKEVNKGDVATEVTNKNTSKASNQLNYISINFGGFTHKLTRVQTTILLEDFLPSTETSFM